MSIQIDQISKMVRFRTALILTGLVISLGAVPTWATLMDNLHGSAQLSGLQSETPDGKSNSLGQDYTVNWSRSLFSYLGARASVHYYNLGVDERQGAHTWRAEYQPSGEILWNHPLFAISGRLTHHKSSSNDATTKLIQNNSSVAFATRDLTLPILKVRYEWDHSYNAAQLLSADTSEGGTVSSARNTRNRLWQAALSYARNNQDFYYSLSRNRNSNLITGLKITDVQHQFRWNQTGLSIGQRMRLYSSYSFEYRTQEITRPPEAPILKPIPFVEALYIYDATPDLGQLDSLPALADGNTTDPVIPNIDIGRGLLDRNIGVDFGFPREVSAIYVYTDRPSGSHLSWRIYISDDNLTWKLIIGAVQSIFSTGFSRYEISFPPQTTRYIKAVNYGSNDVATALVTELETWDLFPSSSQQTSHQSSHLVSLGSTYTFSKKLELAASTIYEYEPKGDFTNSRNQLFYSFSLLNKPSAILTHSFRLEGGTEKFKTTDVRNSNTGLTYNLRLTPIETLEFSIVTLTRSNYINSVKIQEYNNLFFLTKAGLLDALTVSGDAGYSRNNLFDSKSRFDTWSYHLSASGAVVSTLDMSTSLLYQTISTSEVSNFRTRRQYQLGANYRMTPTIYLTGAVLASYESGSSFVSQDYSTNWNMSQKLSVGATYSIRNNRNGIRFERYNARLSFQMTPRTLMFADYSNSSSPSEVEGNVNFLQIGLNTGF